jgi:hypothetical protein
VEGNDRSAVGIAVDGVPDGTIASQMETFTIARH